MKVILTEDHDTLGTKGDLVDVKPGYGQNYLIPRQLAVVATKSATKRYAEERRQSAHKVAAQREQAEKLAQKLDGTQVVLPVQTGEDNRIFGSITTQQIVDELKTQGFDVDRRKVTMSEDPRTTGDYTATVRFYQDVTADVQVKVVANEDSI